MCQDVMDCGGERFTITEATKTADRVCSERCINTTTTTTATTITVTTTTSTSSSTSSSAKGVLAGCNEFSKDNSDEFKEQLIELLLAASNYTLNRSQALDVELYSQCQSADAGSFIGNDNGDGSEGNGDSGDGAGSEGTQGSSLAAGASGGNRRSRRGNVRNMPQEGVHRQRRALIDCSSIVSYESENYRYRSRQDYTRNTGGTSEFFPNRDKILHYSTGREKELSATNWAETVPDPKRETYRHGRRSEYMKQCAMKCTQYSKCKSFSFTATSSTDNCKFSSETSGGTSNNNNAQYFQKILDKDFGGSEIVECKDFSNHVDHCRGTTAKQCPCTCQYKTSTIKLRIRRSTNRLVAAQTMLSVDHLV